MQGADFLLLLACGSLRLRGVSDEMSVDETTFTLCYAATVRLTADICFDRRNRQSMRRCPRSMNRATQTLGSRVSGH